ncbi:MAG: uroporphyrinogen-III C-methyltransferase [Gammaproteobacteria bacterium]|nr:uroporphyrinogen-III C-methyltransferase [Gammaproteobacteria bacterium]
MSDKDNDQQPVVDNETVEEPGVDEPVDREPVVEEPVVEEPPAEPPPGKRSGNSVAWLAFLFAIVALAAAGYTAWQDRRDDAGDRIDSALAGLEGSNDQTAQAVSSLEARVSGLERQDPGVDAAVDALRRDVDEQLRLLDSLPARMSTLESSVASLAGVSEGARDAWILAESEYYLQIANAQLQLANNPHLATLALKMADERIVQLANPALTDVRRAISDELAALEVMEKPDIEGATLTLASLARVVEALPLAGAEESAEDAEAVDPQLSGPGRAWASVKNAMSGLVKVTPPERAKLAQLSPDTEFFLRNNIALQLQAARLALLRGEQAVFEQTLDDTTALLNDYFDLGSTQVAGALETIGEIRGHVFTADMPDISASLQLLRQHRSLQESAQ